MCIRDRYNRGGGVKGLYRKVCFSYIDLLYLGYKQWIVQRIEYDNSRSCNIVLLKNRIKLNLKKKSIKNKKWFFSYFFNTFFMYRLANEGLKKGDIVNFFEEKAQNFAMENQFARLRNISTSSYLFNIEYKPYTHGKLVRSAGSKAKLLRKYDKYGLIALPSGEKKLLLLSCFATLGLSLIHISEPTRPY